MKLYDIVFALAEYHGVTDVIPRTLTGTTEERVSQLLDIIGIFREQVPHLSTDQTSVASSIPQQLDFYEAVSTEDIYRVLGTLYDVGKFVNPSHLLVYSDGLSGR
jgi:hypothetical protein